MTFQASSKLGAEGSLSHGIYYGSSIAVIIHSFDHSFDGSLGGLSLQSAERILKLEARNF